MFLKYILGRNKTELVSKVFWAQVASPEKGDWATIVGQDLKDFGVNQTFSESSAYVLYEKVFQCCSVLGLYPPALEVGKYISML